MMTNSIPIISLEGATVSNGETNVLFDVDFHIDKGDFVYITGKVGTGKTSLIRTIIAENPLTAGRGRVCGFNLPAMKDSDIPSLRRKMGVVFQDFQLLMDRSVHDNLDFVLRATSWKNRFRMEERIGEVLRAVGMYSKMHKMPYQLSGGEQQRVAIARSLLNMPDVILADEPTGNLDAETTDGIMQLLSAINSRMGTAVVIITHNNSIMERYPGRTYVCADEHCTETA